MVNTLKNKEISISVSSRGAELISLQSSGIEYLWQGDSKIWPHPSPLLFPVIGLLPEGEYFYEDTSYRLDNHGFIAAKEFELIQATETSLEYRCRSDDSSRKIYPFDFTVTMRYLLQVRQLKIQYQVDNPMKRILPFSIGAHPAFNVPLIEGESREDYELHFEHPECVHRRCLNSDNLLSGEKKQLLDSQSVLAVSKDMFDQGAIILSDHTSRSLKLKSRKSRHFVEVGFPGFPALGIWSPAGGEEPFICLEPWHGIVPEQNSDKDILKKEGILLLEPEESFHSEYSISVG